MHTRLDAALPLGCNESDAMTHAIVSLISYVSMIWQHRGHVTERCALELLSGSSVLQHWMSSHNWNDGAFMMESAHLLHNTAWLNSNTAFINMFSLCAFALLTMVTIHRDYCAWHRFIFIHRLFCQMKNWFDPPIPIFDAIYQALLCTQTPIYTRTCTLESTAEPFTIYSNDKRPNKIKNEERRAKNEERK